MSSDFELSTIPRFAFSNSQCILTLPVSCLAFSDLSLTCKARDGSEKTTTGIDRLIKNNIKSWQQKECLVKK